MYIGVVGLASAVVDSRTVDAGVVHADQHQHLLVLLTAHDAGQDLLVGHLVSLGASV